MKRFTGFILAALLVLAPLSASALEALTDSNMNDITGQAGVSIAIDNVVIYQNSVADVTYTDTDGTDGLSTGLMIDYADNNSHKLITVDAITDDTNYGVAFFNTTFGSTLGFSSNTAGMAQAPAAGTFQTQAKALSIDIGTCPVLTAGNNWNYGSTTMVTAGVVIGLPTVEIAVYNANDTKEIKIVGRTGTAINDDRAYIQITKSGYSKYAILGGTLEIAPH